MKKIIVLFFILISFNNTALAGLDLVIQAKQSSASSVKIIFNGDVVPIFNFSQNRNNIIVKFKSPFKATLREVGIGFVNKITVVDSKTLSFELTEGSYNIAEFSGNKTIGLNIIRNNIENDPIIISQASDQTQIFKPGTRNTDQKLLVTGQNKDNEKTLIFNWQRNVASAVFYREGYLWVIFNEFINLNLDQIKKILGKDAVDISFMPNNEYTVIRIQGDYLDNVKVFKNGFTWIVKILKQQPKANPSISISQYKTSYTKNIFFAVDNIEQNLLEVLDPVIGDSLKIVLFYNPDIGVMREKKFIDFIILPSSQGFVINPIADIGVKTIDQGIEISKSNSSDKSKHVYSALPFDRWSDVDHSLIFKIKNKLEADIVKAEDFKKNDIRFELVKFLLGNLMVVEAESLLKYILELNPNYLDNKIQGRFIRGVINFMLKNYSDAQVNFASIDDTFMTEADRNELNFWRKATILKLKGYVDTYDFLKYKDLFLKTYPKNLYYQFAYLDLENSMHFRDFNHANEVYRIINIADDNKDPSLKIYKNSNMYYLGHYLLNAKNDAIQSIKTWQKLTDKIDDPYNRVRAIFAIVKTLYENNQIKLSEAIDYLERARIIWHGGDLEFEIIDYLGNLYLKNEDYINTLRIWQIETTEFGDKINQIEHSSKMSQLFYQIFINENDKNKLSLDDDLKKISLFYEFRELTPIGKMGDKVITSIINKMIDLDLLSRAENLLSHQVNYRLSGIERLNAANRLARIYLIDMKPEKAIEVLDNTKQNKISDSIDSERNCIRASALLALKKYEAAKASIEGDDSDEAKMIKTNIAWAQKNWGSVVSIMESYLDNKLFQNSLLSPLESTYVLEVALSYVKMQDMEMAKKVCKKYMKIIDKNNQNLKKSLDYIGSSDKQIDYQDIENSLGDSIIKHFIETYKQDITQNVS